MEGFLLGAVAVQQAAREGPPRGSVKREGERVRRRLGFLLEVEQPLYLCFIHAHGVAGEGEELGDADLGLYEDGEVADFERADDGTGRQVVCGVLASGRLYCE